MIRPRASLALPAALLVFALGATPPHKTSDSGKDSQKGEKAAAKAEKGDKAGASPASWYARSIVQADAGIVVWDYWSKGRKLRAETTLGGTPIETLVNGEFYTIIDGLAQRGISIRRAPAAIEADRAHPEERPFGREADELTAKGAELIRSDKRGEQPCRVYRLTDDRGRSEVWITDDKRKLPLHVEFFTRDSGAHTTTDYIDWVTEIDPGDAFFEPDPRVELEHIEYDEYVKRVQEGPVGPAPVLFSNLLHGR